MASSLELAARWAARWVGGWRAAGAAGFPRRLLAAETSGSAPVAQITASGKVRDN